MKNAQIAKYVEERDALRSKIDEITARIDKITEEKDEALKNIEKVTEEKNKAINDALVSALQLKEVNRQYIDLMDKKASEQNFADKTPEVTNILEMMGNIAKERDDLQEQLYQLTGGKVPSKRKLCNISQPDPASLLITREIRGEHDDELLMADEPLSYEEENAPELMEEAGDIGVAAGSFSVPGATFSNLSSVPPGESAMNEYGEMIAEEDGEEGQLFGDDGITKEPDEAMANEVSEKLAFQIFFIKSKQLPSRIPPPKMQREMKTLLRRRAALSLLLALQPFFR